MTRRELRIASLHLFTGDQFCDTAIPGIYIRGVYKASYAVLLMFMPCKQSAMSHDCILYISALSLSVHIKVVYQGTSKLSCMLLLSGLAQDVKQHPAHVQPSLLCAKMAVTKVKTWWHVG